MQIGYAALCWTEYIDYYVTRHNGKCLYLLYYEEVMQAIIKVNSKYEINGKDKLGRDLNIVAAGKNILSWIVFEFTSFKIVSFPKE